MFGRQTMLVNSNILSLNQKPINDLKTTQKNKIPVISTKNELPVIEKKLTYKKRKSLPQSSFALHDKRKYPIHDISHAQNALSRVSAHGSPAEKKQVRAAVNKRYPSLKNNK